MYHPSLGLCIAWDSPGALSTPTRHREAVGDATEELLEILGGTPGDPRLHRSLGSLPQEDIEYQP